MMKYEENHEHMRYPESQMNKEYEGERMKEWSANLSMVADQMNTENWPLINNTETTNDLDKNNTGREVVAKAYLE